MGRSYILVATLIVLLFLAFMLSPALGLSFVDADTGTDSVFTSGSVQGSPAITGFTYEIHAVQVALSDSSTADVAHSPIEEQLASIKGKYTSVWGYNSVNQRWRGYFPSEPLFASNLVRLEVGEAYWIKATEDCTLSYGGSNYTLDKGWNIIGWLGGGGTTTTPRKGGGCFIATAAFDTPMAQEIDVLREFRDEYLQSNPVGRLFVSFYYRSSPSVAEFIDDNPVIKPFVRVGLLPALYLSRVAVGTTLAEKTAVSGGLALVLFVMLSWLRRKTSA